MLDEIKRILCDCELETITELNHEQVVDVYYTNQEFAIISEGKQADRSDCKRECLEAVKQIPPDFRLENKLFFSVWKDSRVAAVLDLLLGYPDERTVWIGLLLIHGDLHGRKLGSRFADSVQEAAENKGFSKIQLGVIDRNVKALSFWESLGYKKIRETRIERGVMPDWNVIVMEKELKTA